MESHPDQTAAIFFSSVCRHGVKCPYRKQRRCWFRHDVSLLDAPRRRRKIAGKTDEIRDIWNDNAAINVETVRAWDARKARGLHDGCAFDVEGGEGGRFERASGGSVFRRKEGRRSCRTNKQHSNTQQQPLPQQHSNTATQQLQHNNNHNNNLRSHFGSRPFVDRILFCSSQTAKGKASLWRVLDL